MTFQHFRSKSGIPAAESREIRTAMVERSNEPAAPILVVEKGAEKPERLHERVARLIRKKKAK